MIPGIRWIKKAALCFFLLMVGCIFCSEQTAVAVDEKSMMKDEIREHMKKKHVVKKVWYLDYDRNGRSEAFVLTGERGRSNRKDWMLDDTDNDLWFAYVEGDHVQVKRVRKHVESSAHLLKLKSATLMCAGDFCVTSYPEDVYAVSGDSVRKIFHGDTVHGNEDGDDVISVHSTYDSVKMLPENLVMGHTWKPYYFYYRNGEIQEYQGRKISMADFRKYENAEEVLKKYKRLGRVTKIICRENGLIHINYTRFRKYEERYHSVTLIVKDGRLVVSDAAVNEGRYAVNMPR